MTTVEANTTKTIRIYPNGLTSSLATEYNKSRELSAVADFRKLLFAHCNWPQHGGDAYCAEKPPVSGWAKGGQRSGRAVCTSSNLSVI
ncbi:hypothetical protein PoB_005732700 [Plakobranchus ocellatus]|uniref:Uncharacterized protein n=1 Tax=Plakobranchus ocellatus TaxID=259542 RepID=A0AAV4CGW2_9GAST|nr:hypothetical protein PoB_005732700 [Plakobranchus ocellatus]